MPLHEHVARAPRYPVHLAVEFRVPGPPATSHGSAQWLTGTSHNISAGGILFSPDRVVPGLAVDTRIEMRVLMPPELKPPVTAWARCVGRIVRIERESFGSPARIAATIDRYKFERRAPRN